MSNSQDKDPASIHPGLKSLDCIDAKLGSLYFRAKEGEGLMYMTENAFLAWKAMPSSKSPNNRPFLIFIHDYGSSSRIFNKLASQVKNHCLAIDLRGWGRSGHTKDESPRAYSITQMKNDMKRIIGLLQGEKFFLVGHGMGAKVAQLYATQQPPKNFVGMALVAPAPPSSWKPSKEVIEGYKAAYSSKTRGDIETFTKEFLAHSPMDPIDLENLVDDGMKDTPLAKDAWLSYGMEEDFSQGIARIIVPVVVVYGSYDKVITPEDVEREIGGKFDPQPLLLRAEKCGHLVPLEYPDLAHILNVFSNEAESMKALLK